jgi:tRNA-specific 2-thiouridylase
VLGEHGGHTGYTVGQRKGLGAFGARRFVVGIDAPTNVVLIGDEAALMSRSVLAERLRFTSGTPPAGERRVLAKIRYKSAPAPALLRVEGDTATVTFDAPQRAVTPGQAIVFYDRDEVLGGGTIERAVRESAAP